MIRHKSLLLVMVVGMWWGIGGSLAYSQVTLSTNSLTLSQRQSGPPAFAKTFTISGTGNISLGACSPLTIGYNPCGNGNGFTLTLSSATSPATATASLNGYFNNAIPAGLSFVSWNQDITSSTGCTGSCTVTITLMLTPVVVPTFSSISGSFTGCVNTSATWYDLETCTFQGGLTPGPSPFNMWPGQGSTYTDGNFGGTVRQLSPNPPTWQVLFKDSIDTAINLDNTLVLTSGSFGDIHVRSITTGVDLYPTMQADTGNGAAYAWSSLFPKRLFYLTPGASMQVRRYDVDTKVDALVYQFVGGGTSNLITNGDDTSTSKDDWWCFQPNGTGDQFTVLVNLNTGQTYNTPHWPTTPVVTGNGTAWHPRACANTVGVNIPDGNRYFMQIFNGPNSGTMFEKYHLTAGGSVVDDGMVGPGSPSGGSNGAVQGCTTAQLNANQCFYPGHFAMVESAGVQYLVFHDVSSPPYLSYIFWSRYDSPAMTTSVEAGGGMYATFPFGGSSDSHTCCAKFAPICVTGTDNENTNPIAYDLLTVSASGSHPVTGTTDFNYPGANGDSLLVGGVYCNDGSSHVINGVHNMTGLSGATVGFAGTTSTCTRSLVIPGTPNNSGSFILNVAPPQNVPHQEELFTIDGTNVAGKVFRVKRLAKSRSITINDWLQDSYFGQSHPVISMDGSMSAFESNNGTPSIMGVFTVPTAYSPFVPPVNSMTLINGVRMNGVLVH